MGGGRRENVVMMFCRQKPQGQTNQYPSQPMLELEPTLSRASNFGRNLLSDTIVPTTIGNVAWQ